MKMIRAKNDRSRIHAFIMSAARLGHWTESKKQTASQRKKKTGVHWENQWKLHIKLPGLHHALIFHHKTLTVGHCLQWQLWRIPSSLATQHLTRSKNKTKKSFLHQIRSIWLQIKLQLFSLHLTFNKNHLFTAAPLWEKSSRSVGSGASHLKAGLSDRNRVHKGTSECWELCSGASHYEGSWS